MIRSFILILAALGVLASSFASNSNYTLTIFALFLIFLVVYPHFANFFRILPLPTVILFLLLAAPVMVVIEWGAVTDASISGAETADEGTVESLNLLEDIVGLSGFYAAWALGSYIVISRFKYSTKEVFILASLFGILVEQQFAFFGILVSGNLIALLFWIIYIPLVYAPFIMIPYLLLKERFNPTSNSILKYPLGLLVPFIVLIPVALLWDFVVNLLK